MSEATSPFMTPYAPPPPNTLYMCILYTYPHREGGGGRKLNKEKVRGAIVHKAGSKIPT
jgi:hypothetical protein